MSDTEREKLVTYLARHPDAGEEIKGSGGCRKLRWAGRSKGKRGGLRVITFFSGQTIPVFLLTIYGKGDKADLTPDEIKALSKLTKVLVESYRRKVQTLRSA